MWFLFTHLLDNTSFKGSVIPPLKDQCILLIVFSLPNCLVLIVLPFLSAVLMVDDDMLISAQDLAFAFSVWQVRLLDAW